VCFQIQLVPLHGGGGGRGKKAGGGNNKKKTRSRKKRGGRGERREEDEDEEGEARAKAGDAAGNGAPPWYASNVKHCRRAAGRGDMGVRLAWWGSCTS
jgi:hypothetical protein